MINRRILAAVVLALVGTLASAQSWMASYEKGLAAAKKSDWMGARAAFQQAIAYRPEDASGPTTLPGPVTDRRQWRDGAPYSPNFIAAYCEYRIGSPSKGDDGRPALQLAASEFEALLAKGQDSRETFFYLGQIYARLGDTQKRLDLESRYKIAKLRFRVDVEVVSPEDLAVISGNPGPGKPNSGTGPQVTIIRPGQNPATVPSSGGSQPTAAIPMVGPVPPIATKYALIIGNSTGQLKQGAVPFGSDDAQAVREALVTNAGYPEANVDLVLNTTKDQLMASAKALAERMPEDATLFFFYAGNGANVEGRDYLAGVDATSDTDPAAMAAKMDVYRLFNAKGTKIFAFFEVARPMAGGVYFGKEIPMVGAVAQVQSTIPGEAVYSEVRNGKQMGVFADAIVASLQEIRSNRIPIMEFGWQLFNRTRGGGSTLGSGTRQVPTLPVLTHLSDQERF